MRPCAIVISLLPLLIATCTGTVTHEHAFTALPILSSESPVIPISTEQNRSYQLFKQRLLAIFNDPEVSDRVKLISNSDSETSNRNFSGWLSIFHLHGKNNN